MMRLAQIFILLSLASVLIVTNFTLFPFVVGKTIFFRTVIELALLAVCFQAIMKPTAFVERWRLVVRQPLVWAITFFVIIFSLAGFLGHDPATSFWSNYIRGEGVFQMWHYYIFFLLLLLLFSDNRRLRWLLWATASNGALAIIAGLFLYLQIFLKDGRFQGTIGNPAFAAAYFLFALWYFIFLFAIFIQEKDRRWGMWLAGGGAIASLIIIFLTGTRGAFLGLVAGVVAALIYYGLSAISKQKRWYFGAATGCLIIIVGSLLYWQPLRIFQISFQEQTAQTRLWTWGSAWRGIQERPLLGWGPENFSEVFNRYFDKRHYAGPNIVSETWFDRAHNIFIDYAATTGIIGLLSYLGIWLTFYYCLFWHWRIEGKFQKALFIALPVAYLVQGLLIFDTLPVLINVFFFLALAIGMGLAAALSLPEKKEKKGNNNFVIQGLAVAMAVALVPVWYVGNYRPLKKSILFVNALQQLPTLQSFEAFQKNFSPALDYWSPYGQDELLKMLGAIELDLLKNKPPIAVAQALTEYLNNYYQLILARDKGHVFAQNYYILGQVNELAGKTENARNYYQKGVDQWPLRPDFKDGLTRVKE